MWSRSYSLKQTDEIVQVLRGKIQNSRIVMLFGELGAGKTTLTRALLRACGVEQPVTSPTYTYVQCYSLTGAYKRVCHFDLYRLSDQSIFFEMGFDEYLYDKDTLIIIEWPEVIFSLLPDDALCVTLSHQSPDERGITIEHKGERL